VHDGDSWQKGFALDGSHSTEPQATRRHILSCMGGWRAVGRLRGHLVSSQLHPVLEEGEGLVAWAHVHAPEDGRHGIVALTPGRCLVHWTARDRTDVAVAWAELAGWCLTDASRGGPVLILNTRRGDVAVRLPVSSKARARRASALLQSIAAMAPTEAARPVGLTSAPELALQAERRGLGGHTRRVVVTVIGLLLILFGLLFASPFVPGPGLLTILAGLAVLAREYDWAKDAHVWLKGRLERLLRWRRSRRRRRDRGNAGVRQG
jgi:uncharacterized protein (TIGR02611 family)